MTTAITIGRRAWISECGTYRWTLERIWGTGGKSVLFVGLNPSTADAQIDDPTVLRWIHFARSWGFDRFIAVNLYPFRSSSPQALRRWVSRIADGGDWAGRDAMYFDNTQVIREYARTADLIVPCWGAGAWDLDWVEVMVEALFEATSLGEIHCLGTTAADAPMHPMARGKHRIPDDRQPILWRSM
jgi:hypothetical protein